MQKNILVMIQSMTGYGKATAIFGEKKINVEIKSLNSKAMDLSTRIAPLYREKEMEIRNMISKSLERGKVDFSLWIEKDVSDTATPINAALVENYYNQIKSISEMTHGSLYRRFRERFRHAGTLYGSGLHQPLPALRRKAGQGHVRALPHLQRRRQGLRV